MNLHELVSQLIINTKGATNSLFTVASDSSIAAFAPELTLCVAIVLMLLVRMLPGGRRIDGFYLAFIGSAMALYLAFPWIALGGAGMDLDRPSAVSRMEIFTGMLVYDRLTVYMRAILLMFLVLFTLLCKLTGIPDREDSPDVYTLILGATLGMCLMASANHLLMVFLAVEMASVPSYALAGLMKGRRSASEAALKYSVYGAGAAGVMLYGISLVSGLTQTAHLPTLAVQLSELYPAMNGSERMVLALAGLMIMVGLAYKLSAVPFHFWAPDVFEGATAEINAFLSVASKAAALALLVRVCIGLGAIPPEGYQPGARSLAALQAPVADQAALFNVADEVPSKPSAAEGPAATQDAPSSSDHRAASHGGSSAGTNNVAAGSGRAGSRLENLGAIRGFSAKLIALLAAVTCTFGNLAAYGQTNIKRLLAYSTIAHAGYMMMAVPAMLVMINFDPLAAERAVASLAIYIGVYLFMNLGAFAIVAMLRNVMRSEQIADYAGLIRRCPTMAVCFSLILFSLIGMPPLSGFVGKFAIFAALTEGYQISAAGGQPALFLLVLLLVGGINTALSLFYYLRVVKVMTIDPEPEARPPFEFAEVSLHGAYIWLITLPTAVGIIGSDSLYRWANEAAKFLLT